MVVYLPPNPPPPWPLLLASTAKMDAKATRATAEDVKKSPCLILFFALPCFLEGWIVCEVGHESPPYLCPPFNLETGLK